MSTSPIHGNNFFPGVAKPSANFSSLSAKTLNVTGNTLEQGSLSVQGSLSFYNAPAVSQPSPITNALTGGSATAADCATKLNLVLATLRELGLIQT
jgi:hypothetical protein